MARGPDRDDPLSAVRRLLRDLRNAARLSSSPVVEFLCPGVPLAHRQAAVANVVRIALYRLPSRQRELLQRYDLEGEPALKVQRDLGLSARQFFRDRHAALFTLSQQLLGPQGAALEPAPSRGRVAPLVPAERCAAATRAPPLRGPSTATAVVGDAELVRRTLARSLAQSGDVGCLRVLKELALHVEQPARRADLLLDLADAASEYEDEAVALEAGQAVARIVRDESAAISEHFDYLSGRLARTQGRLADTRGSAMSHFARATSLLRQSIITDARRIDARSALSDALGDVALLHFAHGAFADARKASLEASTLIETFALWSRPRAIEILAMDAALHACLSGNVGPAVRAVASLLERAIEAGWCSTASRLGADLVGLNAVRGDYDEAIRWYRRLASSPLDGARPADRVHLTMEAAHSYTMSGRPAEALSILGYVRPGAGCPSAETPAWHAFASAALERLGDDATALAEAQLALDGYTAQQVARGAGDAHRLIGVCHAKLGDAGLATEHIIEAQRLIEMHGTPYAVLRTLVAKANILDSAPLKLEAIEFARLLLKLGKDSTESAGEGYRNDPLSVKQAF